MSVLTPLPVPVRYRSEMEEWFFDNEEGLVITEDNYFQYKSMLQFPVPIYIMMIGAIKDGLMTPDEAIERGNEYMLNLPNISRENTLADIAAKKQRQADAMADSSDESKAALDTIDIDKAINADQASMAKMAMSSSLNKFNDVPIDDLASPLLLDRNNDEAVSQLQDSVNEIYEPSTPVTFDDFIFNINRRKNFKSKASIKKAIEKVKNKLEDVNAKLIIDDDNEIFIQRKSVLEKTLLKLKDIYYSKKTLIFNFKNYLSNYNDFYTSKALTNSSYDIYVNILTNILSNEKKQNSLRDEFISLHEADPAIYAPEIFIHEYLWKFNFFNRKRDIMAVTEAEFVNFLISLDLENEPTRTNTLSRLQTLNHENYVKLIDALVNSIIDIDDLYSMTIDNSTMATYVQEQIEANDTSEGYKRQLYEYINIDSKLNALVNRNDSSITEAIAILQRCDEFIAEAEVDELGINSELYQSISELQSAFETAKENSVIAAIITDYEQTDNFFMDSIDMLDAVSFSSSNMFTLFKNNIYYYFSNYRYSISTTSTEARLKYIKILFDIAKNLFNYTSSVIVFQILQEIVNAATLLIVADGTPTITDSYLQSKIDTVLETKIGTSATPVTTEWNEFNTNPDFLNQFYRIRALNDLANNIALGGIYDGSNANFIANRNTNIDSLDAIEENISDIREDMLNFATKLKELI